MTAKSRSWLAALLLTVGCIAHAGCPDKVTRSDTFMALVVPDGAPRPADASAFSIVNDDMGVQSLFAAVGPPDGSDGITSTVFVWCLNDGTQVRVTTRDGSKIDNVRHDGKLVYKRKKK